MNRRSRIAMTVGAVLAVVVGLLVFSGQGAGSSDPVIPAAERRTPIALAAAGMAGERVDLAALRGAPVVLNFWASWCGPCQAEQPDLERAAAATRSAGVHFVGVNIRDTNQAAARAFLAEYKVSYPTVVDTDLALSIAYGVPAPPATFVLDAQGRVAVRILGGITSGEELVQLIERVGREKT